MAQSGRIGLSDIYAAKVLTDDKTAGMTFETPFYVAPALEAKLTNTVDSQVVYGDDKPQEVAIAQGEMKLDFTLQDIDPALYAKLFGKTVNSDGVVMDSLSDTPPYYALMFKSKKANGEYRYVVLYKGRFTPSDEDYKTQQGKADITNGMTTATFIQPEGVDAIRAMVDSDGDTVSQTVIDGWFTHPYIPATQGA
jgi:phi13 family phage major tail protein